MKRYLLNQREELTDAHLQTEWTQKKLGIKAEKSIVGFFGPIKTQKTLGRPPQASHYRHNDVLHLIVSIPKTSSLEVMLLQRLLASTVREAIPGTQRIGPDIRIQEQSISLSYVAHFNEKSIVYMGVFLEFEELNPLFGLKRTEQEPNDIALGILSSFCEELHLIDDTIILLDQETQELSKKDV